jgi:mannitol/fructose-specific phosphotransferase system IIA component (Ntr-type)
VGIDRLLSKPIHPIKRGRMDAEKVKNKALVFLAIIIEDESMTDLEKGLMTATLHNSFMDYIRNKDKYKKLPSGEWIKTE